MPIKAGIVGLGVGEAHIQGYKNHPDCKVTLLCDFDEVKLQEVSSRHPGIRTTTDPEEVLRDSDIDMVSIASYDNYHYKQIVLGIEQEKHLFIEKPICLSEKEAEGVLECLEKK